MTKYAATPHWSDVTIAVARAHNTPAPIERDIAPAVAERKVPSFWDRLMGRK